MAQNWEGCHFLGFFTKNLLSHAQILSKNVQALKNTLLTCPYFSNKRPFSQNRGAIMTFFYIFLKNPLLLYPYLVKNVNSVKTKSIGCSFFPIFHDNVTAFMPMLCQKNFPSLKNTLLMPIFVQRNVHSLKNIMIKKKYREKPPTVMPIFRQKHQLCRNYIKLWVKKVDRMPFS